MTYLRRSYTEEGKEKKTDKFDRSFLPEALEDAEDAYWDDKLGLVMQTIDVNVDDLLAEDAGGYDLSSFLAISGGVVENPVTPERVVTIPEHTILW